MNGTIITSAVCRKLHSKYPDISIYREHIEDGFVEPSFFVWTSGLSDESAIHPRLIMRHRIEINYFPVHSSTSMYEDCLDIGMALLEHLSRIEVEIGETTKPVFGIHPSYTIVDDNMLQFSIEYRIEGVIDDGSNVKSMGDLESEIAYKQ